MLFAFVRPPVFFNMDISRISSVCSAMKRHLECFDCDPTVISRASYRQSRLTDRQDASNFNMGARQNRTVARVVRGPRRNTMGLV